MAKYTIESRAGVVYGTYEGETPRDAFLAMLAEAGDDGDYGEPHVGTEADWIIELVPEPMMEYFTRDNTDGTFTDADLDLMNTAVDALVEGGMDVRNACDRVNDNWRVSGNTLTSLTK